MTKHDKDEIVLSWVSSMWCPSVRTVAEYLYKGELKSVEIGHGNYEIIKSDDCNIFVKGNCGAFGKYVKIDRATAVAQEIPKPAFVLEQELAEKKSAKKEKASGRKNSAKSSEQTK